MWKMIIFARIKSSKNFCPALGRAQSIVTKKLEEFWAVPGRGAKYYYGREEYHMGSAEEEACGADS